MPASPVCSRARRAVVLAIVAATAGCGLVGPDPGRRVLIVGDSVTYQSRTSLEADFTWADELDVQAINGLRTDELLSVARQGVSHHPSTAAFMPGYNDVLQNEVASAKLPEMMDLANEVSCSVWLLIPTRGGYSKKVAEAWNARVREEAEDRDNVHVIDDWANLVDRAPGFELVKRRDAVHPNLEGQHAIARVMSGSIKRTCGT